MGSPLNGEAATPPERKRKPSFVARQASDTRDSHHALLLNGTSLFSLAALLVPSIATLAS